MVYCCNGVVAILLLVAMVLLPWCCPQLISLVHVCKQELLPEQLLVIVIVFFRAVSMTIAFIVTY